MGNSENKEKHKKNEEVNNVKFNKNQDLENRNNEKDKDDEDNDKEINRQRYNYPSLTTDVENIENDEENDKFNGIKTSLKFMYKNNFVSATFDDICAHIIQASWKKFKCKNDLSSKIDVIYTSSKQDKIEKVEFLIYGYKYRKYDILDYTGLKDVLKVNYFFY